MGRTFVALGLASLAACAAPGGGAPAPERPNILVVLVDDLGLEAFGCYGGESYSTPHVDRLAASGMRFAQAHTTPLCTPTRVRLLTGRGGARSYAGFSILDREERTFAHLLRDAGYATAAAGKWQLLGAEHYGDQAGTGTHPRDAGFERYCLWQVEQLGSRFAAPTIDVDGELRVFPDRYGPDVYCDYLLDFVAQERTEPFLAFFPMALTHAPFEPTPASADAAAPKAQLFADMVAYMDGLVGRLIDGLEALGLRDDTLIVFTTDNGSPGAMRSRAWDRTVKGGKGKTTDAGTHVPLIVSWPGVVPAGTACGALVDLTDVLPTLAEAGGAALPGDRVIDGRSLWPHLTGTAEGERDALVFYYNPRPGNPKFPERRWARGRRYKLYGDGRFYDVVADPDEKERLQAESAPARHAALASALAALPAAQRLRFPAADDS
ncbi:MAG: sulfatase-like hydrolase/transferase [Planctomycetota bacterium]